MNTLYDYLTHVKGVEYIISILFIAGYLLYAEMLKPKPFKTLKEAGKEDLDFIKNNKSTTITTIKKIVAAPFIGLGYLVALPFAFAFAAGSAAFSGAMGLVGR